MSSFKNELYTQVVDVPYKFMQLACVRTSELPEIDNSRFNPTVFSVFLHG